MNEKIKFVTKVTIIHCLTYFICGLIFTNLFNYEELFKLGNAQYFMKDAYGVSSLIGPLAQIFRGAIIGCVLLLLKDTILNKKYGWLKLWIIFAGLGIICVPAASPVSIEGIIYSKLPLEFHIKVAPEIFIQTLLFSILVTGEFKFKIPEKLKVPVIVTAISAIGFSISGVILALVLGVDFMASASDPYAFLVMFLSLVIVFFITKLYVKNIDKKVLKLLYYTLCYLSLAGLPTLYNYLTNSILKSPLSLIFSGLPVILIGIYMSLEIKKLDNKL